jgi:hypothetical protein
MWHISLCGLAGKYSYLNWHLVTLTNLCT